MTATVENLTALLAEAGATQIKIGRHAADLSYARFKLNGLFHTRWGINHADLLTRCERFLESINGNT